MTDTFNRGHQNHPDPSRPVQNRLCGSLLAVRVWRQVQPQALQQVGGRSSQTFLTAERLQQVGDQVQVHIQRLDLLLFTSLSWESVGAGGVN